MANECRTKLQQEPWIYQEMNDFIVLYVCCECPLALLIPLSALNKITRSEKGFQNELLLNSKIGFVGCCKSIANFLSTYLHEIKH